jgi:ParB-like chromosome segregation protein Spo0J
MPQAQAIAIPDSELPPHPLAALLPAMTDDEFNNLVSSIKRHGQLEPIVVFEGAILDGRHRYKACRQLGIQPEFSFPEIADPPMWVKAKNVDRRHLKESQLAIIAASFANYEHGGDRKSFKRSPDRLKLTNAEAAKMVGVSEPTVRRAKRVLKEATPEEIEAVRDGKTAVNTVVRNIQERVGKKRVEQGNKKALRGELWAKLRDSLDNLAALPRVADVLTIARDYDARHRTSAINGRIQPAIEWLEEFRNAWESNNG